VKRVNVMEIAMDVAPKRNADLKVVDWAHNTARKEGADQVLNADQKEVTDRKDVDQGRNAAQTEVVDRRVSEDLKKVEALSLEDPGGVVLKGVSLG
jgi:hypothetical protein